MTLNEVDAKILEIEEELEETLVNLEDDLYAVLFGYKIIIPELNLSVREGVCGYLINDEFEPDFSASVIYEADEENPSNWLYYENDPVETALHNFCRATGIARKPFSEQECILKILRA